MAATLLTRSVHDLTASAWFGGPLMGANKTRVAEQEGVGRPTVYKGLKRK